MKALKRLLCLSLSIMFTFLPIISHGDTSQNTTNDAQDKVDSSVVMLPMSYDLSTQGNLPTSRPFTLDNDIAFTIANSLESHLLMTSDSYKTDGIDPINTYIKGLSQISKLESSDTLFNINALFYDLSNLKNNDQIDTIMKPFHISSNHILGLNYIRNKNDFKDNDHIKKEIMKNGAITSILNITSKSIKNSFDPTTLSWYNSTIEKNKRNHAYHLNIIGWDDSYSKENFLSEPEGNGAFLCTTNINIKNNSTSISSTPIQFYISYYDKTFMFSEANDFSGFVFTGVNQDLNEKTIYQHDTVGFNTTYKSKENEVWIANTYERSNKDKESLDFISFYTLNDNTKYQIYFSDRINRLPNPKYFKPIKSGTLSKAGYHTISFDTPVELKKDNFTISIKLTNEDEDIIIPLDTTEGTEYIKNPSFNSFIKMGSKSFVRSTNLMDDSQICLRGYATSFYLNNILLSPKDMKEDIDTLLAKIKKDHPTVKTVGFDSNQIKLIDSVYKAIEEPLPVESFYFQANKLLVMLNDRSAHILLEYIPNSKFLDIPFVWLKDGIYVTKDTSYFKKGDKLLSIGGAQPKELLDLLRPHVSSDNDYGIMSLAPKVLTKHFYLKNLNLILNNNYVQITYKRHNKQTIVNYPLSNHLEYTRFTTSYADPAWAIDHHNNLAIFTINNWFYDTRSNKSEERLEEFFTKVAQHNIENICFDLRDTDGSHNTLENEILSYLNLGPLYYSGYIKNTFYCEKLKPKKDSLLFSGNVFIMTSYDTQGRSIHFMELLIDNGEAYMIGEPTSFSPASNPYYYTNYSLPNSLLQYRLSEGFGNRPGDLDVGAKTFNPHILVNRTGKDLTSLGDIQMSTLANYTKNNHPLPDLKPIDSTGININFRQRKELYFYKRIFDERDKIVLSNGNSYTMKPRQASHDNRFRSHYIYVTFNTKFSDELYDPQKIYLTDTNGTRLETTSADRAHTAENIIVFTPKKLLQPGKPYIVNIEPGSIKDVDGKWNSNHIKLQILAK